MASQLIPYSGTFKSCPICWGDDAKSLVVHQGADGAKHPYHRDCLEIWLKNQRTCPSCRMKIGNKVKKMFKRKDVESTVMVIMGLAAGFFFVLALQHHFPDRVKFTNSGPDAFIFSVVSCALLKQQNRLHPIGIFMLSMSISFISTVKFPKILPG